MAKSREKETDSGIQGEYNVTMYDEFQQNMRDRGWIQTNSIIQSGITEGSALELGPGPGYLGLEWLKHTQGTTLTGLDISADMISLAERNAANYKLVDRVTYVHNTGASMPFEDNSFDAVFTTGSLHEWSDPLSTFEEMWRVLKPKGRLFVSDLRRDMLAPVRWFIWLTTRPKGIRPGFVTSLSAAYTPDELETLIANTDIESCSISGSLFGLQLTGVKE